MENRKVNKLVNKLNKEKTWAKDKLNLDSYYLFNKKYFRKNAPIFRDLNPLFLLQFGIILPFDLPFETKEYSVGKIMENDNKFLITLIFSRLEENSNLYFGFKSEKKESYIKCRTRCEITISLQRTDIVIDDLSFDIKEAMVIVKKSKTGSISQDLFFESVNKVFSFIDKLHNIALHELNCMILSYAMLENDMSVHSISTDDIEFVSHFRGINIPSWETFNWMKLNNIEKFPEENKQIVTNEVFAQSLAIAHEFGENQFSNYQAHLQDAKYSISQGNLRTAVVQLNTATEVLLSSIVTLYWEHEESCSLEESHDKLENTTFSKIIKSIIPQIIGGSWDISLSNSIVSNWYNSSYILRNRIVHGGYNPDKNEMYQSISRTFEFYKYIIELMQKSNYGYLKCIQSIPKVTIKKMN